MKLGATPHENGFETCMKLGATPHEKPFQVFFYHDRAMGLKVATERTFSKMYYLDGKVLIFCRTKTFAVSTNKIVANFDIITWAPEQFPGMLQAT